MEFSFTIDNIEYHVPLELDVALFSTAMAWDISIEQNIKPFVSVITKCPIYKLDLIDKSTYDIITGVCLSRIALDNTTLNKRVASNGIYYDLIDFDTITFGQFIDFDVYITDGMAKNAVQITSKLYNSTEEIASRISINKVWKALLEIVYYREHTYKDYEEFFGEEQEDIQEGIDTSMPLSTLQLMWYNAVLVLADKNFLDIHKVTERPLREALNFLTWKKNEMAKAKLQNLKRKNDIQRTRR